MKVAMFVLGITELLFILIGACLNSDHTLFLSFVILSIIEWVAIALSVLSIISFCI